MSALTGVLCCSAPDGLLLLLAGLEGVEGGRLVGSPLCNNASLVSKGEQPAFVFLVLLLLLLRLLL